MWDNLLGQIYTDYVYDNSGNKVVSANGRYAASGSKSLGSIVPDYNMGLKIRFVTKLQFSFLIDRQKVIISHEPTWKLLRYVNNNNR
jgi:hypothetical protein